MQVFSMYYFAVNTYRLPVYRDSVITINTMVTPLIPVV